MHQQAILIVDDNPENPMQCTTHYRAGNVELEALGAWRAWRAQTA